MGSGVRFSPDRPRILWPWVRVPTGVHPAFHPCGVDTIGTTELSVDNKRPPGVAPWLYRSHETEQFDGIDLHPIAEVSAGFHYEWSGQINFWDNIAEISEQRSHKSVIIPSVRIWVCFLQTP